MVRFSSILIVYFVIGAVMWGGGAIAWSDVGVGEYIIDDPNSEDNRISDTATDDLNKLDDPISNVVSTLGGGLIAVWSVMSKFIGFLFWPVLVLYTVEAPTSAVVLGGGSLSIAFIAAFLRTVRGSA